jgi:hypothetical protein
MFPLMYSDAARGSRSPRHKALQSLPGLDYDRYPEIVDVSELEPFGDAEGLFQMPFPMGMPYLDFTVIDMYVGDPNPPDMPIYRGRIELPNSDEYFYLETLFVDWPNQGSGGYPNQAPTNPPSPVPLIQISSSDPTRRVLRNGMQGPNMFERPIPADQINGQSIFNSGSSGFAVRHGFWFSPRDVISIEVRRAPKTFLFPEWVSVGFAGRMITKKFIQGVICEKK